MVFKWSSETFRKTERLSTGESHDYSGERYWIDIISVDDIKMDVVLKSLSLDGGPFTVTGKFRVNGTVIKEWSSDSLQEAAAIGEKLISAIKDCTSSII